MSVCFKIMNLLVGMGMLVASPAFSYLLIGLTGPPGAGKGTVAAALSAKYGIPQISLGDIVRDEIRSGTTFGKMVEEFYAAHSKADILPDSDEYVGQLLEVVVQRLESDECKDGAILDGISRSPWQAIRLHKLLLSKGKKLNLVFRLQAREDVLLERLGGRLVCKKCRATYHKVNLPPLVAGQCDHCKTGLSIRDDDKDVEIIRKRLSIFYKEEEPIATYYSHQNILEDIDANGTPESVFESAVKKIEERQPRNLVFDRGYLERVIPSFPHHENPHLKIYNLVEMFKDAPLLTYIVRDFAGKIRELNPDFIAAPEARALPFFGALMYDTSKPGIFLRKLGKLPAAANKIQVTYETAYSKDTIEMNLDENLKGKTVVLVDDGISSGGTTLAAVSLLEKAGMTVLRVLAPVQYHYRPLCSDYLSKGLQHRVSTLFDLGKIEKP